VKFISVSVNENQVIEEEGFYLENDLYLYILYMCDEKYEKGGLMQISVPRKNENFHGYPVKEYKSNDIVEQKQVSLLQGELSLSSKIWKDPFPSSYSEQLLRELRFFHENYQNSQGNSFDNREKFFEELLLTLQSK
jgi:hypothetical protein